MERVVSVVREGGAVLRLPPGFRFHPTDEELVEQYLLRKVTRRPLPAYVVRDVELARFDPWDLPGGGDVLTGGSFAKERYFFNFREAKYRNGSRSNRAAGTGYWKATGRDRQVVGSKGDRVVGMKKVLVFHRGKPPHGQRTNWVMHEYRLATTAAAPSAGDGGHSCGLLQGKDSTANGPMVQQQTGDWVLCRIFQKRGPPSSSSTMDDGGEADRFCERDDDGTVMAKGIRFIDFLRHRDVAAAAVNPPPQASDAAETSCVTDISCESGTSEEEGNSLNCSLNLFTRRQP